MEHADTAGSVAEAVKYFVLDLKRLAEVHNQKLCFCDDPKTPFKCVGFHVMMVLESAKRRADPLYEGMDIIEREQIVQGVLSAIHMVK